MDRTLDKALKNDPTATAAERQTRADEKELDADQRAMRAQITFEKMYHHIARTNHTRDVFVFVLMSDGADTVNETEAIDKQLNEAHALVRGARMESVFKVVGIGRESDTYLSMRCKLAVETMAAYSPTPCYYARQTKQLVAVVQEMARDLKQMLHGAQTYSLHVSARNTENFNFAANVANRKLLTWGSRTTVFGGRLDSSVALEHGFVPNHTLPPVDEVQLSVRADQPYALVFSGPPPTDLRVNGAEVPVYLSNKPVSYESVLRMLTASVMDVKVSAVAHLRVEPAIEELRKMVDGVKSQQFRVDELKAMTGVQRVAYMKRKKQMITELEST